MQGVPGRFVEETPKDSFQLGFLAVKDWQPDLPALERENQGKIHGHRWCQLHVPGTASAGVAGLCELLGGTEGISVEENMRSSE